MLKNFFLAYAATTNGIGRKIIEFALLQNKNEKRCANCWKNIIICQINYKIKGFLESST